MPTILVVSVHPDDEALGCGGSLLRHRDRGDAIHWLVLTEMAESRGWPEDRVREREGEIRSVADTLHARVHLLGFPAAELHTVDRSLVIRRVGDVVEEARPDILYLPNRSDAHSDHRIAFEGLWPLTKRFRHPSIKRVLMYECLSETNFAPPLPEAMFSPNWFVDISDHLDAKVSLMETYRSEMAPHPFPRSEASIRALATLRGTQAGVVAAEAFMLLREVEL